MSRWPILFVVAVLGFSATSGLPLFAQVGGVPSAYGPPPLSPWLNLYTKGGGPVDPYHMFVQPSLQLNNALQGQQADIQRNTAGLGTVSNRVMTQMEEMRTGPEPTGMGASFLNHGVYFNTNRRAGLGVGAAGVAGGGTGFGGGGAAAGRGTYAPPTTNTGGFGGMGASVPNMSGFSGMGRGL